MELNNTKLPIYIFCLILFVLLSSCGEKKQDLKRNYLSAQTDEEVRHLASDIRSLGVDGVPIFVEAMTSSLEKQDTLIGYSKLIVSLKGLNELAKNGIFTEDEVFALLLVLKKQRSIQDSLLTADTIYKITNVNVGYNLDFVKNYTVDDENARQKLISEWEGLIMKSLHAKSVGSVQ